MRVLGGASKTRVVMCGSSWRLFEAGPASRRVDIVVLALEWKVEAKLVSNFNEKGEPNSYLSPCVVAGSQWLWLELLDRWGRGVGSLGVLLLVMTSRNMLLPCVDFASREVNHLDVSLVFQCNRGDKVLILVSMVRMACSFSLCGVAVEDSV
ncbi:hypothetical protein Droror1_Dr00025351 [Drosera rotundifolia]